MCCINDVGPVKEKHRKALGGFEMEGAQISRLPNPPSTETYNYKDASNLRRKPFVYNDVLRGDVKQNSPSFWPCPVAEKPLTSHLKACNSLKILKQAPCRVAAKVAPRPTRHMMRHNSSILSLVAGPKTSERP